MNNVNPFYGIGGATALEHYMLGQAQMRLRMLDQVVSEMYPFRAKMVMRHLSVSDDQVPKGAELWVANLRQCDQLPRLSGIYLVLHGNFLTEGYPEVLLFPVFPVDVHDDRKFIASNGGIISGRFGIHCWGEQKEMVPDLLDVSQILIDMRVIRGTPKTFRVQGDPTNAEYVNMVIPGFGIE